MTPWLLHPFTKEKRHIVLDACHVVKLKTNALGEWKCLKDGEGNSIKWSCFENVVNLQEASFYYLFRMSQI